MPSNEEVARQRAQAEVDAAKAAVDAFSSKQYTVGDGAAQRQAETALRNVQSRHSSILK